MNLINLFRIIAILEGLSYVLLLFIATPIKYFTQNEILVKLLGMPHGILFIAYIVMAFLIKNKNQWINKHFIWVLLASLIPFGTFVVERKITKKTAQTK